MPFTVPESAFALFYDTPVAFHGRRAPRIEPASRQPSAGGYGARPVDLTVDAMVTEGDANASLMDAAAPTREQTWTICVRFCDWKDLEPPQVEDEATFRIGGMKPQTFRVSSVTPQPSLNHFEIVVRTRGGRNG